MRSYKTKYSLFTLFLVIALCSSADQVTLDDGQCIQGKILSITSSTCTIQTGNMQVHIPQHKIRSISRHNEFDNLVNLAEQLTAAGNFSAAIDNYTKALKLNPDSKIIPKRILALKLKILQIDIQPIEYLLKHQQFDAAITKYKALLDQTDIPELRVELKIKISEAYCYAAEDAVDKVNYNRALFFIKQALDFNPNSSNAHLVMAKYELHRYEDPIIARQEVQLALDKNPGNSLALEQLRQLTQLEKHERAKQLASIHLPEPDDKTFRPELPPPDVKTLTPKTLKEKKESLILDNYLGKDRSIALILQAYNAGPGAVLVYNGDVPYRETRNYVPRVINYFRNGLPRNKYDRLISKYSRKYQLDENLVKAIIKVESDFNRREFVPRTNACGLMQIVPVDWHDTTKRLGVNWKFDRDVWNPEKNLEVGCHYLAWLRDDFLPLHFSDFQL